jgi:hypothetical protein
VQAEALCDVHAQSAGDPLAVAADEGVTAASATAEMYRTDVDCAN